MNQSVANPSRLYMTRDQLAGVPPCALPRELAVRFYAPGDEHHWVRLHAAAAPEIEATEARFWEWFGTDQAELTRRQLYLVEADGRCIATITAWQNPHYAGGAWGRIHFVAVAPDWQGRGLSNALLALGCQRLRELGHDRAYLVTDDSRVRAINLYLKFGFVPHVHGGDDAAAWKALQPALRPGYRSACNAPLARATP